MQVIGGNHKDNYLTFLTQICLKMDLGLKIEEINVGIRISILWIILCVSILDIQKTNVGIRLIILEILCVPIFRANGQLLLFGPNLPKNRFWPLNFKNLIVDLESTPPRYHVYQFSGKKDNFEFFHLNLGKLPNYR